MRCPDDGHQLGTNKDGPVPYQYCRHCDGLWFPGESLASDVRPVLPPSHNIKPDIDEPARKRTCPACEKPLTAELVGLVVIDLCYTCGGAWLDPGEYPAARRLLTERRMAREMPQLRQPVGVVERIVDTLLDVFGTLFVEQEDDGEFDAGRYIPRPDRDPRRRRFH